MVCLYVIKNEEGKYFVGEDVFTKEPMFTKSILNAHLYKLEQVAASFGRKYQGCRVVTVELSEVEK